MKWVQNTLGKKGDLEARVEVENPVEPEYPIKILAKIWQPEKKGERCFGKVDLDIGTKTELFRVYHQDIERVKMMIEEGLKNMASAFGKVMGS